MIRNTINLAILIISIFLFGCDLHQTEPHEYFGQWIDNIEIEEFNFRSVNLDLEFEYPKVDLITFRCSKSDYEEFVVHFDLIPRNHPKVDSILCFNFPQRYYDSRFWKFDLINSDATNTKPPKWWLELVNKPDQNNLLYGGYIGQEDIFHVVDCYDKSWGGRILSCYREDRAMILIEHSMR